ncbi:mobile mystery protein B [Nocardioides sp. NPDC058538]|uniref:mobile mystery protein B n=1 Tax=Nocardioides sp. NPDC058538 TaxID=3346542 RepID=UPI00365CC23A
MNTQIHETQDGETPIDEDDREFLMPAYAHITTRDELNLAEATNIVFGIRWLNRAGHLQAEEVLDQWFLRDLHRNMFGRVWTWAGRNRTRQTNIGVDPGVITERWAQLLDQARGWIEYEAYSPDEICVRLHHRLASIHPFTNGNGRHARVTANKLAESLGLSTPGRYRYEWGFDATPAKRESSRRAYLDALHTADGGDYRVLVELALRPAGS